MNINEKILEIFQEFSIKREDGICYLLSLFFGYQPSYIPDMLKQKVNASGIVIMKDKNLHWNVPLFQEQQTAFEWVGTEYEPLFKDTNPAKSGKVREAVARMKSLFAKYPDIRKEEVIEATKMYLRAENPMYIRFPHYFIEKGKGVDKTHDLLDWIDKYRQTYKNVIISDNTDSTLNVKMQ